MFFYRVLFLCCCSAISFCVCLFLSTRIFSQHLKVSTSNTSDLELESEVRIRSSTLKISSSWKFGGGVRPDFWRFETKCADFLFWREVLGKSMGHVREGRRVGLLFHESGFLIKELYFSAFYPGPTLMDLMPPFLNKASKNHQQSAIFREQHVTPLWHSCQANAELAFRFLFFCDIRGKAH